MMEEQRVVDFKCIHCGYEWIELYQYAIFSSGCINCNTILNCKIYSKELNYKYIECESLKYKRLCRQYFQSFTGYNFPPIVINNFKFEGYCKELKLAFIIQKSKKKMEIVENNINLLYIPVEIEEELENYILQTLFKLNCI